jgi:colanic acid/amylovoran biosynthesis glycosyltransferase
LAVRTLVIYTLWYPFGTTETFLHNEVHVVAPRFDRVVLVPTHYGGDARPLPVNVETVGPIEPTTRERIRGAIHSLWLLAWTFACSQDRWRHVCNLRTMWQRARADLDRLGAVQKFIAVRRLEGAVHYDYWMVNSTLTLATLRAAGHINALICRAHNYDLYDERYSHCVPFRDFRMAHIDHVAVISQHGQDYLNARTRARWRDKISFEPLGIPLDGTTLTAPDDSSQPPLIVTVSRIDAVKRLDLLIDALHRMDRPVRWVHIGDGPDRAHIAQAAQRLPSHVRFDLRGHLPNDQVFAFYRNHPVRLLINVSSAEGLPVSMMEAAAFGVPIVATAVGGVPELVTPEVGMLLPESPSATEIAQAINAALEANWNRARIRTLARARFDSKVNFERFGALLAEL